MEEVEKLYQMVFRVAKKFLDQSKRFTISQLQTHNDPSYEELAEAASQLAAVIDSLAKAGGWGEERISLNARQAALLMEQMALAIVNKSEDDLERAAADLEKMDFI